jgi:hypothetical protein
MGVPHSVQHCRWAEPTLYVVHPYWTAAEEFPWSCNADGAPRPVEDTGICRVCGRWRPRECDEKACADTGCAPDR